jgi:glycosyltransferase involved in cell wall biosynthesis
MPFHGISLFTASRRLVRKIHAEFPFDIIDGHYIYPDGFAAVLLGKMVKRPVVLSARGSDINQFAGFRSIKPMIRYALNGADHLISVCKALKDEMVSLGAPENKVTVIPNGIDKDRFYPDERQKSRRELGISSSARMILSVGSLIERKGFHVLLDAMPQIIQRTGNVNLFVVGEGPYRSILERQIVRLGLAERVFLVGERPNQELGTWYCAADVFCLASSREGWANVIMESLACGTPVVATNVWGAPEIITDGSIGSLVERSPQPIAEALINALDRHWDRELIRKHVEKRAWESVAREVRDVFLAVSSQNGQSIPW